ncbi:MAG: sugar transferase [Allosphingosinicella sp.]
MIRVFKHYMPYAVLLLGTIDFVLLLLAAEAGWTLRVWQIDGIIDLDAATMPNLLAFTAAMQGTMVAVGIYGAHALQSVRFAVARLLVAFSLGILLLSLLFFLLPPVAFWRSSLLYATLFAFGGLVAVRAMLRDLLGGETFRRRVLVLGAGPRAARLEALAARRGSGFSVVGFVGMNDGPPAVARSVNRADLASLPNHLLQLRAGEVVLALEERRNALPLNDLLRIKTTGVTVYELSSFLERETGRVDLDSLNPSFLIFSDGFSAGRRLSSAGKRLFDVVKIRSLRYDAEVGGKAVWAQRDDPRVTRIGRLIRKLRIDELPQAWSVLRGEMSFVGPRPERPQFVADLEARLPYYAERHVVKPGITGWAQINYPYGASIEDAREKLEFDLYYAKNYTPFLDILILLQTARVILWPEGAR